MNKFSKSFLYISLLIDKLKQKTWTHIVALINCIFIFFFLLDVYHNNYFMDSNARNNDFLFPECYIFFYGICSAITITVFLFFSFIVKTRKIKNKFLLNNSIYGIIWYIGLLTGIYSFYTFVLYIFNIIRY